MSNTKVTAGNTTASSLSWKILLTLILPYSVIFIFSIVGNLLVIATLIFNRSMRSVTNIFLLNLAISDLLLGVFCMPFTLSGVLLRRFVFGQFLCHLISYLQAVSVAVSVWTLMALSIERYYAICHPLRSREYRQTRKHAYRILVLIWALALLLMSPTAIMSELQQIQQTNNFKCREAWPSFGHKEAFTIFLDLVLLVVPLLSLIFTYSSIVITLKQKLRHSSAINKQQCKLKRHIKTTSFIEDEQSLGGATRARQVHLRRSPFSSTSSTATSISIKPLWSSTIPISGDECNYGPQCSGIIPTNGKTLTARGRDDSHTIGTAGNNKNATFGWNTLRINSDHSTLQGRQRRVVWMLCVVVIEFFICWTPIFIVDTLSLYRPELIYGNEKNISRWLGIDIVSACHLLCFCSSGTNPVTYAFMNRRFRQHFCALFRCRKHRPSGNDAMMAVIGGAYTSNLINDNESEVTNKQDNSMASFAVLPESSGHNAGRLNAFRVDV